MIASVEQKGGGGAKVIPFLERSPEFYRLVAEGSDDEEFVRACLLLAADDIDRWRGFVAGPAKKP